MIAHALLAKPLGIHGIKANNYNISFTDRLCFLCQQHILKYRLAGNPGLLQMASRVENRIAFAFPVLRIDRLDNVNSTLSESSFREIFSLAIITSKFTMIGMVLYS